MINRVPISAEARGKLRIWWRAALARHGRIEVVIASRAFQKASSDFGHKRKTGRTRALLRLQLLLREANFEQVRWDDGFALWSYAHPRESVIAPTEGVGSADLQDCCTVDFVVAGRTWNHHTERVGTGLGKGLWSIEICRHALGRLLQRDPGCDVDATIFEAHGAALSMRPEGVPRFLIRAGRGAFICSLRAGPDLSTGRDCVFVSAHTWISNDMMADTQHLAACSDVPEAQLGASLLRPLALRHLAVQV